MRYFTDCQHHRYALLLTQWRTFITHHNRPMANIVAAWVRASYRIVPAIREHVVADDALTGGDECVRIDEATYLGVVVAGL